MHLYRAFPGLGGEDAMKVDACGTLATRTKEHSFEGNLMEQHVQSPDLTAQHGYEFTFGTPHKGHPIVLHVNYTAPLQPQSLYPVAQKETVSQGQSRKESKNRNCRGFNHVLTVNPSATQLESEAETRYGCTRP